MLVVLLAMFLAWATPAEGVNVDAVSGMERNAGQLVGIAAVITIGLIQARWRPAWIGAGFIVAVLGRQFMSAIDSTVASPGIGMILGLLAGAIATGLLIWQMFADVRVVAAEARAEADA